MKFVWVDNEEERADDAHAKRAAPTPGLASPGEIEVNPAWLEPNEPGVIVSEAPSSVSFADAVRVFIGPDGEVELASNRGIPRGYVEAVVVSTAMGARLSERLGRAKAGKVKQRA